MGCVVVVLLAPFIAWLGGLAHQHADTVPIMLNSMANLRFLRTSAKVLTTELRHSVCHWPHALLADLHGKLAWHGAQMCRAARLDCTACLAGSSCSQGAAMHCAGPTSFRDRLVLQAMLMYRLKQAA